MDGLPVETLASIGNMALAFAAVDVNVSMLLGRTKSGVITTFDPKMFKQRLSKKLDKSGRIYPSLKSVADRINSLSERRNDLMHGSVWTVFWSATSEPVPYHAVSNEGTGRRWILSVEDMDRISEEAMQFASEIQNLISK